MIDSAPTRSYITRAKSNSLGDSPNQKEGNKFSLKKCLIVSLIVLIIIGITIFMISFLSSRFSPRIKSTSKETSNDGSHVIYEVASTKKNMVSKDLNSTFTVTAIKNPSTQRRLQLDTGEPQTKDIEPVILTFTFAQEGITIRAGNIGSYIVEVDPDIIFKAYSQKNPEQAKRLLYQAELNIQLRRLQTEPPVEEQSMYTINTDHINQEFDRSLLRTVAKSMNRNPDDLLITNTEVIDLVLQSDGTYDPKDSPQSSRLLHSLEKVRNLQQWQGIFDHINNAILLSRLSEVEQTLETFILNIDNVQDKSENDQLKKVLKNSNFYPNSGQQIIIQNTEKEEENERILVESVETTKYVNKTAKSKSKKEKKMVNQISNSTEQQNEKDTQNKDENNQERVVKNKLNETNQIKGTTETNNIIGNVKITNHPQPQSNTPSNPTSPVTPETQSPPPAPEVSSFPSIPSIPRPQFAPPTPSPAPIQSPAVYPANDERSYQQPINPSSSGIIRPSNEKKATTEYKVKPIQNQNAQTKIKPESKPTDSQQSKPQTKPTNPADSQKQIVTNADPKQPKPAANPAKPKDPQKQSTNGTIVVPSKKVEPALGCIGSKQNKQCHLSAVNKTNSPVKVNEKKLNNTKTKPIKIITVNSTKDNKNPGKANAQPSGTGKNGSPGKVAQPSKSSTPKPNSPQTSAQKPTQTTQNPASNPPSDKKTIKPVTPALKPTQPTVKPPEPKPSQPKSNPNSTPVAPKPQQRVQPKPVSVPQTKPQTEPQPQQKPAPAPAPQPKPAPAPARPAPSPQRLPIIIRPAPPPPRNFFLKK